MSDLAQVYYQPPGYSPPDPVLGWIGRAFIAPPFFAAMGASVLAGENPIGGSAPVGTVVGLSVALLEVAVISYGAYRLVRLVAG